MPAAEDYPVEPSAPSGEGGEILSEIFDESEQLEVELSASHPDPLSRGDNDEYPEKKGLPEVYDGKSPD